jgi:hypothetical protein
MGNFKENPFIDFGNLKLPTGGPMALPTSLPGDDEKLSKSIEPMLVSKAAVHVFNFLVKQIKEDLTITFFTNLQGDFLSDKYEPLRALFPLTYNQLKKIGGEIHKVSSYIDTLGKKFRMDFENIYANYPKLLRLSSEDFKGFLKEKPELKIIFTAALHLIDPLIRTRKHPGNILDEFNIKQFENEGKKEPLYVNLKSSLQLLKITANSLKYDSKRKEQGEEEGYWIHPDSLRKIFEKDSRNNLTTFKIYLGLLFQQGKAIEFLIKKKNSTKPVTCKLKDVFKKMGQDTKRLAAFKDIIEDFGYQLHYLDALYKEMNPQDAQDANESEGNCDKKDIEYNATYYRYYHTTVDTVNFAAEMFDYVLDTCEKRKSLDLKECAGPQKFSTVARALGETFIDIKNEDFSSVVLNILSIFDEMFTEPGNKRIFKKNRKKILRYGSFMAKMVKAGNDPDDAEEKIKANVEKAIKSAVLPGGSYSHKRNSPFNISLNAYLGFTMSDEHLEGDKEKKFFQNIDSLYLWAPVGIAFSARTRAWFIGSASLFFSAIDLGAVAAFRVAGGKDDGIPQFSFKNIIAPGAHFVLGLKKIPVSIGAGIQYGPQLRRIEIEDENTKIIEPAAWRFNIFFALDIPIFNLK